MHEEEMPTDDEESTPPRTPKPWPTLRTDEAAEAFVAEADLTEYDLARMHPVDFEIMPTGTAAPPAPATRRSSA